MENLGNRIKKLRTDAHLTQKELGIVAGIHNSNIGRIEKGQVYPTADVLLLIANYFGVSCDWIITGQNAISQTEGNTEICDFANDKEMRLLENFRTLSEDDQDELLGIIDLKVKRAHKVRASSARSSGSPKIVSDEQVG